MATRGSNHVLTNHYNERFTITKFHRIRGLKQELVHLALVVDDYDEAIHFYTNRLGFELIEDTYQPA